MMGQSFEKGFAHSVKYETVEREWFARQQAKLFIAISLSFCFCHVFFMNPRSTRGCGLTAFSFNRLYVALFRGFFHHLCNMLLPLSLGWGPEVTR